MKREIRGLPGDIKFSLLGLRLHYLVSKHKLETLSMTKINYLRIHIYNVIDLIIILHIHNDIELYFVNFIFSYLATMYS